MNALPAAVVVFGASGFIGRNIVDVLAGRVETLVGVTSGTPHVPGCTATVAMRDVASLPALPPDAVVINVAAFRYAAATFHADQSKLLTANVAIANAVYGFCAARGIKEVRLGSSVAVYPATSSVQDDNAPVDLNAWPHAGEAAYAWSKRWAEVCAEIHLRQFGVNTLSFRLSNPYGPYDSTDVASAHVAPAFIIKALAPGDTFEILGNADAERDFIFSGDVAATFAASLAHRGEHGAFNLVYGKTVSIRQLAKEVLVAAERTDKSIVIASGVAPGVNIRRATGERVRAAFKVPAFADLRAGLAPSVKWSRHALGR
jgi:nucleoside-diphosphate-sugar epimerase